jgi:hypothetical protein
MSLKPMFGSLGRNFAQKGGNSALGKSTLGAVKTVKPVTSNISHKTF